MENCLPFTDDVMVVLVHKCMQQTHLLALHLETLGYIPRLLNALNGLVYFLIIGDPRGDNLSSLELMILCFTDMPLLKNNFIVEVCNCSMFCCTLLYVHSSIAIILMGKKELVALLNLSYWCLVMVEWLFLVVPWGCLRFVIVVFPDHTHLIFFLSHLIFVCVMT